MNHPYDSRTDLIYQQRVLVIVLIIALLLVQIGRHYWIVHQRRLDERTTN